MSLSFSQRIIASPDIVIRVVGEETVILNLKTELYLGLDSIGTQIWSALIGSESIQVAFERILATFDVGEEELHRDFEEFIGKLLGYQLIELTTGDISASVQSS